MMLMTTTVEHDGRGFTVRSTLGDDCRLAMLRAFVRAAVDQAGGEVNPDAREVADWLTEEVGHTSTRTVSQLLRQLVHAGDLTRRRVGNSWYYAPTPAQQVMIAAISAPPRRRERIPPASHASAGAQTDRQAAVPKHAAGVPAAYSAANQPVAPSDAGEMQVRCTVADAPSAPPDADGLPLGYQPDESNPATVEPQGMHSARAPAGRPVINPSLKSSKLDMTQSDAGRPAGAQTESQAGVVEIPRVCPEHEAQLLDSGRFGAIGAGGGFIYCPASSDQKRCTFLAHRTRGILIPCGDPGGEVGHNEYRALLRDGGRRADDHTGCDDRTGYVEEVRKLYGGRLPWEAGEESRWP